MSRPNRIDDWTTCPRTQKRRYDSRAAAKRAAKHAQGRDLNPYICSLCDGWHLGHMPRAVKLGDYRRWDLQPRLDTPSD